MIPELLLLYFQFSSFLRTLIHPLTLSRLLFLPRCAGSASADCSAQFQVLLKSIYANERVSEVAGKGGGLLGAHWDELGGEEKNKALATIQNKAGGRIKGRS